MKTHKNAPALKALLKAAAFALTLAPATLTHGAASIDFSGDATAAENLDVKSVLTNYANGAASYDDLLAAIAAARDANALPSTTFWESEASTERYDVATNTAGAVHLTEGVTLTFAGFSNTGNGGMLNFVSNGSLGVFTAESDATYLFTQNTATSAGGAIAVGYQSGLALTNATFIENSATGGGAIHNFPFAILTLKNVTFTGNTATGPSGSGGAIYNNGYGVLTLTDGTFTNNTATSSGGAISNAFGYSTLSDVNFTGNSAKSGGAIFSSGGTVTLTNANFTNNTANGSYGGAIYNSSGTLNLTNANFFNNTTTGKGGAIANYSTVNLNVTAGATVTFSGNIADGVANSIHVEGASLNVFTDGTDAVLDMRDPLYAEGYSSSITKTGAGTWKLGGTSTLNEFGGTTTFTVTAGTLYLYRAGEVGNAYTGIDSGLLGQYGEAVVGTGVIQNPNGTFTLGGAATLALGGGNEISAQTISFQPGATLAFDLANASGDEPILTLHGDFVSIGTLNINLLSLNPNTESFTLVSSNTGDFSGVLSGVLSLKGINTAGTRAADLFSFTSTTSEIVLTQNALTNAAVLWVGGNAGDWNITDENWSGEDTTSGSVSQFLHGDVVNFDSVGGGSSHTITLNAAGDGTVHTAGIFFHGEKDYTFIGNSLNASTDDTSLTGDAAQGKLVLGAWGYHTSGTDTEVVLFKFTGTVDLTSTGTNTFTGGVELRSGTLRIGAVGQLGTTLGNLAFLGDVDSDNVPTLRIAQNSAFVFHGERLEIDNNKSGGIYVEAGATFVVEESSNDYYGGAVHVGFDAEFTFSGQGEFIFRNNTGYIGSGAIQNWGTLALTNATFLENSCGGEGGAIDNNYGTLVLTNVSFFKNTASFGGAIFNNNGGTVTLNISAGRTSTFSGNQDGNSGANSVYLLGGSLNIVTNGTGAVLDMLDPIRTQYVSSHITKTGAGTWKLAGNNDVSGASATFAINAGTLYLYREGEVADANGTGVGAGNIRSGDNGSFTLGGAATLALGGGNEISAQTITLESGATLAFDLANAGTDRAALSLYGDISVGGEIKISIAAINTTPGFYTLVSGGDFTGKLVQAAGGLALQHVVPARDAPSYGIVGTESGVTYSYLEAFTNTTVVWGGGASSDWNTTDANWGLFTADSVSQFLVGDAARFESNAGGTFAITINSGDDGTVHAAGISFGGDGHYTFTGTSLIANLDGTTHQGTDANAKLLFSRSFTGAVDLTGTATNDFAGGVELRGGTLRIGAVAQLGTTLDKLAFSGSGSSNVPTLRIAAGQTVTFTASGTDRQWLHVVSNKTGSIFTEAGATFIIEDNSGDDPFGGAVFVGGAFDFSGDGNFIFRNNVSDFGGAIVNRDELTLSNAEFSGNSALSYGGAIFNSGTATLTDVSFFGNSAAQFGGAIVVDEHDSLTLKVTTGKTATLSGNYDSIGANSVFLLMAELNVVTDGTDAVLDMRDPIRAAATGNSVTKTGTGTWKLGGTNALDADDFDISAGAATDFTVNAGTLYLYRADEVDNVSTLAPTGKVGAGVITNTNGTLTLGSAATLAAGGGNAISAETITLTAGSTLAFDLQGATTTAPAWLTLTAATFSGEVVGAGAIDLLNVSGLTSGIYTLVDVGSTTTVATTGAVSLGGVTAQAIRGDLDARGFELRQDATQHLLQLAVADGAELSTALELTWAGTNGTGGGVWTNDFTTFDAPNWQGVAGNESVAVNTFLDGDTVTFDDTAVNKTVVVDDAGVNAENVTIATNATGGGAYVLSGGTVIVSDALTKTGSGEVTFDTAFVTPTLDVQGGVFTSLSSESEVSEAVSVTNGATLALNADIIDADATRLLDDGTLSLNGSFDLIGTWEVGANGGIVDVTTGEITFVGLVTGAGTFTKTGDGKFSFDETAVAGFSGDLQVTGGAWGYTSGTFNHTLTGDGVLEVTLPDKTDGFTFGADVGAAFTGTVTLAQGTIALEAPDNAAVLANAGLTLTADSVATVTGSAGTTIKTLTLGGGELAFDTAGEEHSPLLTLTGALDATDGGVIRLEVGAIGTTAPAAGENLFSLWGDPENYQRHLIATDSVLPVSGIGAELRVEPIATSATQVRRFADGTGQATFDYTASIAESGADAGLWIGYGLAGISADAEKSVVLDATGAGDARLRVPLTGDGGFHFTGSAGQGVELGNSASTYAGDTEVSKVALTIATERGFGGVAGLKLTDGASVDSTNFAQAVTTLSLAGDTALTAAALTVADGGVVDGTVTVTGTAQNSGVVTGAGTWEAASLANGGDFTAANVVGAVANTGTFTATGLLTGSISNGPGALATLRNVTGAISNRGGVIHLSSDAARWGALDNTGGLVDFVNAGRELRVASLHADPGEVGHMRLDINLLDITQSDRLIVDGAITGRHEFDLELADNFDVNKVTAQSGNFVYVAVGTHSDEEVIGVLSNVGVYDFVLTWDDAQGGYVFRAQKNYYNTLAQAALNSAGATATAWFSQLDSLSKRFGDLRLATTAASGDATAPAASTLSNAFWLRTNAQRVNVDLGITGVRSFHESQYGADVGYDHAFAVSTDAQLYLGGFAAFQSAHRNFAGGVGKGNSDSVAFGGYATWLREDGWYADGVVKGQYFDSDYDASGAHGEFKNYGLGASFEIGRQFNFENATFIEPGVQFSYAHIFAENYTATTGLRVATSDSDVLRAALSVRAGWKLDLGGHGRLSPYVSAGVERQESSGGSVRAGQERWEPNVDGTRANVGLGVAWQLDATQQIHFDYEASFGNKYEKPWGVNLGYRKRF